MMIHEHELNHLDSMAWKVLDHLYGPQRFPAGGGIQNRKQIYEIARFKQYEELVKEASELALKQEINAKRIKDLMDSDIKPMKIT